MFLALKPDLPEAKVLFQGISQMLGCLMVGPGTFDDCVMTEAQMIPFIDGLFLEPKANKACDADGKWNETHRNICHDFKLKWPLVMDPAMVDFSHGLSVSQGPRIP